MKKKRRRRSVVERENAILESIASRVKYWNRSATLLPSLYFSICCGLLEMLKYLINDDKRAKYASIVTSNSTFFLTLYAEMSNFEFLQSVNSFMWYMKKMPK